MSSLYSPPDVPPIAPTLTGPVTINSGAAASVPLTVAGIVGQSADLQDWKNSAGTVLASINASGWTLTPLVTFATPLETYIALGSWVFAITGGVDALLFDTANSGWAWQVASTTVVNMGASAANGNIELGVYSQLAGNKPIVARGAAAQTADLQEWQNSAATVLAKVASDGAFYTGFLSATTPVGTFLGTLSVIPDTTGRIGAVIKGKAGQTASLQEWQSSVAAVLAKVSAAGILSTVNKIYPGTDAAALQTAAGIYGGTGAPSNANGSDGDFYFRSDNGALTSIYTKRAGAWVGII